MEKQYLIQLTQKLYGLTLLFPKKEPLRYKMRELAADILAETVRMKNYNNPTLVSLENGSPKTSEYLGVLDSFFEVVKTQNWVAQQDILNLQHEYSKLGGEIEPQSSLPLFANEEKLPARQERILSFLRENGRAQVWQVKQILPEVTKRTLRRDFDRLLDQGAVERIGERNDTFYQLKVRES